MLVAAIEFGQILKVIGVSLVMGVGVTALFSVVIHGSARAGEARRDGRGSVAVHAAVAATAMVLFAAAVIFGISTILTK